MILAEVESQNFPRVTRVRMLFPLIAISIISNDCVPVSSLVSQHLSFSFELNIKHMLREVLLEILEIHSNDIPHSVITPHTILKCKNSYTIDRKTGIGLKNDYSAPEIIKQLRYFERYKFNILSTREADIYSIGAVAYELVLMEVPDPCHFLQVLHFEEKLGQTRWSSDDNLVDLLFWMIQKGPSMRPSAEEALSHPYFTNAEIHESYCAKMIRNVIQMKRGPFSFGNDKRQKLPTVFER